MIETPERCKSFAKRMAGIAASRVAWLSVLECGGLTPLSFFFLEYGDLTPLSFIVRETARKKGEKQRRREVTAVQRKRCRALAVQRKKAASSRRTPKLRFDCIGKIHTQDDNWSGKTKQGSKQAGGSLRPL